MKRIILFIAGFIGLYLIAVIALNLIPKPEEQPQQETPQVQIQPDQTATPSAQEELVVPDL